MNTNVSSESYELSIGTRSIYEYEWIIVPTFIGEVNPLSSPLPSYSIVLVAVATAVYVLFYAALIMVTFFFWKYRNRI